MCVEMGIRGGTGLYWDFKRAYCDHCIAILLWKYRFLTLFDPLFPWQWLFLTYPIFTVLLTPVYPLFHNIDPFLSILDPNSRFKIPIFHFKPFIPRNPRGAAPQGDGEHSGRPLAGRKASPTTTLVPTAPEGGVEACFVACFYFSKPKIHIKLQSVDIQSDAMAPHTLCGCVGMAAWLCAVQGSNHSKAAGCRRTGTKRSSGP